MSGKTVRPEHSRSLFVLTIFLIILALQVQGQAPVRSRSTLNTENGLSRLLFTFPAGRLVVNLPDDIRPGDTISGTVSSEPAGADATERSANQSTLNGYVVDLGDGMKVKGNETSFKWLPKIVTTGATPKYYLRMIAVYAGTDMLGGLNIPINMAGTPDPTAFTPPALGQNGRPLSVYGPFDGSFSNTGCMIGGRPCEVLAESPRKAVVKVPSSATGPTTFDLTEGKSTLNGELRVVAVNLSAPKTNLMKGENTTLTIQVVGLDGIKEPVSIRIVTTGVVTMDGGNTQTLTVQPGKMGKGGTFSETRTISATAAGAFSVTASVIL